MKIKNVFIGLALFAIVLSCLGLFISRPVVNFAYAGICLNCEYDPIDGWKCIIEEEEGGTFCMAIGHDECQVRGACVPY